jgi:hypothetical protein
LARLRCEPEVVAAMGRARRRRRRREVGHSASARESHEAGARWDYEVRNEVSRAAGAR